MIIVGNRIARAAALSLLAAALTGSVAFAQIPTTQVTQQLSGGSSRKWILKTVVGWLGPGTRCTAGETYTFFANQTVRHDVCTLGTLRESVLAWHTLPDANGENIIEIDGQRYEVRFRDDTRAVYARLRTVVVKGVQVSDLVLSYPKPEI